MSKIGNSRGNNNKEQEEQQSSRRGSTVPLEDITYSKWSGRFTWTAIIQGLIVALLTATLAAIVAMTDIAIQLVQTMLSIPQIGFIEIAALAGLGLYLVVGVIGSGLTAQFYHHFEIRAGKPYKGILTNGLAWTHLVLMNVGIAVASLIMIYGGYLGLVAIGEEAGGFGMTIEQASQQILNPLIMPVSYLLLITVVGAAAGGAGFVINQFQRRTVGEKRRRTTTAAS